MIEPHPDPARRWRHRRRMAWLALVAGLSTPLWVWLTAAFAGVIGPYLGFCGAVVVIYIGGVVVDDNWRAT